MKLVGVHTEEDGLQWHLPGCISDYATLCGLDGDDPGVGQSMETATPPRGQKCNCPHCRAIWTHVVGLHVKLGDFA